MRRFTLVSPETPYWVALAVWFFLLGVVTFAQSHSDELKVTADFLSRESVAPEDPLEISFSRALLPKEGKVAILIGPIDITAMLVQTTNGVRYTPALMPLPLGESEVLVYQISSSYNWKEIARFPLRVAANTGQSPAPAVSGAQPAPQTVSQTSSPSKSKEPSKFRMRPTITLGLKSQAAESHFPEANHPPRATFTDGTLQGRLENSFSRRFFTMQNQFEVAGSSFQNEALRFIQRGNAAPKVDLSNYSMAFQFGKAQLRVGQLNFGTYRHLINGFASRGMVLTIPIRPWVDFSLAAVNGNSIVGWDNFLGLNNRNHQILAGVLGFEFLPKRPGGLRFEAGLLDGSILPFNGFNQRAVNDTEKSHGKTARLLASDKRQRFRLDSGYTQSRFTNPSDPLLEQGVKTVQVREVTRNARYVDTTVNILQNRKITKTRSANLAATYRHEQVDPLFRSVAAFTQADRVQHQMELTGSIGQMNLSANHLRANNNLTDVQTILKVFTCQTAVLMAIPLASLKGDPTKPARWLPLLAYNRTETHQFGKTSSLGFGFDNPSQIPDQVSTNQSVSLDWQLGRYRTGYRFNRSFQDNRQPGRDLADLRNLINGLSFGGSVKQNFDLSYELSNENARNFEQKRTDRLWRSGVNMNWRATKQMGLNVVLTATLAGNLARTSKTRNGEADIQWFYRVGYAKGDFKRVQSQIFIRYANRYARTFDSLFGFGNLTKVQTLSAGFTLTFF